MIPFLQELGLAFDDWDFEYYTDMFQTQLRRDPTNVELFDIAQSNSEHSRHWFFKADLFLDGEKTPHSLFDLVKAPLKVWPHVSRLLCGGPWHWHGAWLCWVSNILLSHCSPPMQRP